MRSLTIVAVGAAGVLFAASSLFGESPSASPDGLWQAVARITRTNDVSDPWGGIESYRLVRLEEIGLRNVLATAPAGADVRPWLSPATITIPMPDGSFQRFRFVESPVMVPGLQSRYPEIRTYLGQGIDDPYATVRFDWTPAGLHALVLSPSGSVLVDPYSRGQTELYVSFYRRDARSEASQWTCFVNESRVTGARLPALGSSRLLDTGEWLQTYVVAVATTGEYTQYYGGTVAAGLAAVATTVNRVSAIYEQEFCIHLQLVANNDLIVYTDPAADPYTNSDLGAMIEENQANLDAVIGSANYDVGHVFGRTTWGGGGLAYVGVVCMNGMKAKGGSAVSDPSGDYFAVEIVAHEMGHEFGSGHTWNGVSGGCSASRWSQDAACEPGSGSTIMAYAGLCGVDNIEDHADYSFHAISYEKIRSYATYGTGSGCPTTAGTDNHAPTVSAGADVTIPQLTPFVLTASGSDPDGDPLTFCWEQHDTGSRQPVSGPGSEDNGYSPLFRSWPPSASPSRCFPRMQDLLGNTTAKGEQLPSTDRMLHMRVTARDNRAGGGGVATADTMLTVTTLAGPFAVTSPNDLVVWSGIRTVTWDVANTDAAPVSCDGVNILLSTDGGNTFPTTLASNVPNNGACSVVIPPTPTTQARVKVEAVGNVFFDVSDTDFTIVRPLIAADFDADYDVDLTDFLHFQACFNGPGRSPALTDCADADFDADNDVDLTDFPVLQGCFNGPNRPPGC